MKKKKINFADKLPADFAKHCTRGDISLLSCSIFGETYAKSFKKEFGAGFSSSMWWVENGQLTFYRSEKEHDNFSSSAGKICLAVIGTKKLANTLVAFTDWFKDILVDFNLPKASKKDKKYFFDQYRRFFAYHQGVYWAADYLNKLAKKTNIIKRNIKILDSAYKYNELVVPSLEKKFREWKISDKLYDEVINGAKATVISRGLLFIGLKRFILPLKQIKKMQGDIEKRFKVDKNINLVKGLGVVKGKFVGVVKKIVDFKKFSSCPAGVVLVTTNTLPQYNHYLRKVGALVTDFGNLLSHASILAREYKIPAVVGTRIATQVFSDGDRVEVDGKNGLVKKINK